MNHVWNFQRLTRIVPACVLLLASAAVGAAIPASERAALVQLYTQTNGDDWITRDNWNGAPGTECSWWGVICDNAQSTVIDVYLQYNNLTGTLPALSGLPNLEVFDIGATSAVFTGGAKEIIANRVTGTLPSFAGMNHLRSFTVVNNAFVGELPDLSVAPLLANVDVSENGLSVLPASLSRATALVNFRAYENQLQGPIPPLAALQNLQWFDVAQNQLTGPLPSLTGLAALQNFDASGNLITGALPSLGGLNALTSFAANNNLLTGGLPALGGLVALQSFNVSNNQLSGPLPALDGLPALQYFNVGANALSGGVSAFAGSPGISTIVLRENLFTGAVPAVTSTGLALFDVSFNGFSGALPTPPNLAQTGSARAVVCPNRLTPAADPATQNDTIWNAETGQVPWSADCAVTPAMSTVALVDQDPAVGIGGPIRLHARVYGNQPTGTVDFTLHATFGATTTLCAQVPLVDGVATCTAPAPLASILGSVNVGANYSGDARNAASSAATVGVFIGYLLIADTTETSVGAPVTLTLPLPDDADAATFLDGGNPFCANVSPSSSPRAATCIAGFTAAGPHILTATYITKGQAVSAPPLVVQVSAAAAFDADQFALTGAWSLPGSEGFGMLFEVFPDQAQPGVANLFGGLFLIDLMGQHHWYSLQGAQATAHGDTYQLTAFESTDGVFAAPPIVHAQAAGSVLLQFADCTHVTVTVDLTNNQMGSYTFSRLSSPTGCSTAVPATTPSPLPANYADVLHSGAYYAPATSGQGFLFDIIPSQTTLFGAWYTYAPAGSGATGIDSQRWLTLQVNDYVPGKLTLKGVPVYFTNGGDLVTPSTQQVGTADLDFTSCTEATIAYRFTAGELSGQSGSMQVQALPSGAGCQ